jgi:hypothetical protein
VRSEKRAAVAMRRAATYSMPGRRGAKTRRVMAEREAMRGAEGFMGGWVSRLRIFSLMNLINKRIEIAQRIFHKF